MCKWKDTSYTTSQTNTSANTKIVKIQLMQGYVKYRKKKRNNDNQAQSFPFLNHNKNIAGYICEKPTLKCESKLQNEARIKKKILQWG